MQIIMGKENAQELEDKYTLFELDTFKFANSDDPVVAYCVIETPPLDDMLNLDNIHNLHTKLLENYRKQNWNFCEQALDHLKGSLQGELDTFYLSLEERINSLRNQSLPEDWSGYLDR